MRKPVQVLLQQAYYTPHHALLQQDTEVPQPPQPENEDNLIGDTRRLTHDAQSLTTSYKAT